MTSTPRRAPKPAPPPTSQAPETQEQSIPEHPALAENTTLSAAFLAWQRQQNGSHNASTLTELLQLSRSLNSYGLTLRHALIDTDTSTRIEAVIEHTSGGVIGSGPLPLPITASVADFIEARIFTTELVLGIAKQEVAAAPATVAQLQATETPTPASAAVPAPAAAPVAADQAAIDALRLHIETLPPDWQTYLTEAFRAQFGLPADRKISPAIKSTDHIAFLRSLLPQQAAL